jgi:caffeoyl-CoA O-methyltransferase
MLVDPRAEAYAGAHTSVPVPAVAAAIATTIAERPQHRGMMAGPAEVALLTGLVALSGARDVLEVGTFTGVGSLALAAGLPPGGQVTTLELDARSAALARATIDASPYADRINLLEGDAAAILPTLPGPFDFVWLDAAKSDYPRHWRMLREKLSARALLVADNVLRGGRVLDLSLHDPATDGLREFADLVQADDAFDNVLLTVGDGLLLAWPRQSRA